MGSPSSTRRSSGPAWQRRWWVWLAVGVGLAGGAVLDVRAAPAADVPSACHGRPHAGSLEHGWKLPLSGANFSVYGVVGWALGRTYVHSTVFRIVLDAYASLEREHPELVFVYGETGLREGGRFAPHRTHQTGTSADFMTPVRDAVGASASLPRGPLNRFGYDIDFDRQGRYQGLRIDFAAIALHLLALRKAASRAGAPIAKVIFYPPLRRELRKTSVWSQIADLPYTKRQVWVRHDDHYHVDFAVRCE